MKDKKTLQILTMLLICTYQQQKSQLYALNSNKNTNRLLEQVSPQSSIFLKISQQQIMFKSIKQLLPTSSYTQSFLTPTISQVQNSITHIKTNQVCNIIRAPNDKRFQIIDRIGHKIKNITQWVSIVMQQSIIYNLEDMNKLQFALDIEAINEIIIVIFQDGEVIFYQLTSENKLKQLKRKWIWQENNKIKRLNNGRIYISNKIGYFISNKQIILINPTEFIVSQINNYEQSHSFFSAQLITKQNQLHIFTANGNIGIKHYTLNQNSKELRIINEFTVTYTQSDNITDIIVSVIDIVQVSHFVNHALGLQIFIILNPIYGLLKISIPSIGSISTVKATATALQLQNCHMIKLHNSLIYTSCPQIVIYNPRTNQLHNNPILMQLPIQLLSNGTDITFISHNSFQTFDPCTGATFQAGFNGETFHHTTVFRDNFISIDDLSVYIWKIRPPQYFLACKPNNKFMGKNTFSLSVSTICEQKGCCIQNFKFNLYIFDSKQGLHIFEALGASVLVVIAAFLFIFIYVRKYKLNTQYNALLEQTQTNQKNNNLSMLVQTKQNQIMQTEQAMAENQKSNSRQKQIANIQ